jgi:hypothetical protein
MHHTKGITVCALLGEPDLNLRRFSLVRSQPGISHPKDRIAGDGSTAPNYPAIAILNRRRTSLFLNQRFGPSLPTLLSILTFMADSSLLFSGLQLQSKRRRSIHRGTRDHGTDKTVHENPRAFGSLFEISESVQPSRQPSYSIYSLSISFLQCRAGPLTHKV